MEYTAMEQYWIWLSSVEGIGSRKFYQLLTIFEDARDVWDNIHDSAIDAIGPVAARKLRKARDERVFYRLFASLESTNTRAIARIHGDYPAMLNEILDPPPTLFLRGNAQSLNADKAIGIVGSRRATTDGRRAAEEFARDLAAQGVTIVSGLARGIDTHAHQGALSADGSTVAALGCGPDVAYPPENARLAQQILDKGGALVSEHPPGTPPVPQNFPPRNRIISGLTQGTLLVEAAKGSGAMITVDFAADQGKELFVVPGSIYSPLSAMPNRLLMDGAHPALNAWDILEFYRWACRDSRPAPEKNALQDLEPDQQALVEPLLSETLSFDELQRITGLSPAKLNSHLTMLILRGIIVKTPGGLYRAYQ